LAREGQHTIGAFRHRVERSLQLRPFFIRLAVASIINDLGAAYLLKIVLPAPERL
jgi:hypothetical protein